MTVPPIRTRFAQAREALAECLATHHAVVWPEAEARLAERPWRDIHRGINPHLLVRARSSMLANGEAELVRQATRGGREVEVLALAGQRGRRNFEDAAARKRLLYARYLGWARATTSRPSLVGAAGERVAHASLLAAMPYGFTPVQSGGGEVSHLLGTDVPGGPLDNAAYILTLDAMGRPLGAVILLVEVKNIRRWIYPWSHELYELLDKATRLQALHPDVLFLPMLVCRRAHFTTFVMAKHLGFYVVQTEAQFILPLAEAEPDALQEINQELAFNDLTRTQDAARVLTQRFERDLRRSARERAEHFLRGGPIIGEYAATLRRTDLPTGVNRLLMVQFRTIARRHLEPPGAW